MQKKLRGGKGSTPAKRAWEVAQSLDGENKDVRWWELFSTPARLKTAHSACLYTELTPDAVEVSSPPASCSIAGVASAGESQPYVEECFLETFVPLRQPSGSSRLETLAPLELPSITRGSGASAKSRRRIRATAKSLIHRGPGGSVQAGARVNCQNSSED